MYAIVKTGGKQYRVEQGQSLLVERLPAADGATVALQPLLFVDGSTVVDGDEPRRGRASRRGSSAHERGPKLRIVKFKPKRGYKRRTGHRQELTRLEVTGIKMGGSGGSRSSTAAPKEADAPKPVAAEPAPSEAAKPAPADPPAAEKEAENGA